MTTLFVDQKSIVRKIWGNSDTILLIFAGASAEFALNKAVDWLYFTGKLPNDPLGRLFSTVAYARKIVFEEEEKALQAIGTIKAIHTSVETKRGESIPDWAYKDVLFMLIDYSIKSYEILERDLTLEEKNEVLHVFRRVGQGMGLVKLPENYANFENIRQAHLQSNLTFSELTQDLYKQYRKHLGWFRYRTLLEAQLLITPIELHFMLNLGGISLLKPLVPLYKLSKTLNIDRLLKSLLLPNAYKKEIKALNSSTSS